MKRGTGNSEGVTKVQLCPGLGKRPGMEQDVQS